MKRPLAALAVLLQLGLSSPPALRADDFDDALAAVARVGPDAAGAAEAQSARRILGASSVDRLPRLLRSMNTDNGVAANYLRSAWDEILARRDDSTPLPLAELEAFVLDARNRGRPRRLALRLLGDDFRERQLPRWLDDPEFRDDAVARQMSDGLARQKSGRQEEARTAYRLAFAHARDGDQVLQAADRLRSVGVQVDPAAHLGFFTRWHLCGPFDAPDTTGFSTKFPPEKSVDFGARFTARDGTPFGWTARSTRDPLGQFNLIQEVAAVKEAVAYAYAEFDSPERRTVQLRCSADDNLSVWLNDRPVLAREQWLNGTRLDRFTASVELRAGTNRMLVKICQGPQHVDPAVSNNWSFHLRLCDADGAAARFTVTSPPADAGASP